MHAMQLEHCTSYGHDDPFTTPNYQITTTPEKEWGIVVQGDDPPPEDTLHGRTILDLALARHWVAPDELLLNETDDPTGASTAEERVRAARDLVKLAHLRRAEVVAVILYTGPMVLAPIMLAPFLSPMIWFLLTHALPQYDLLNCLLRRFPHDRFIKYRDGNNLFSTTIAVLASAVQKIARVAIIPEGTSFFRGLSRRMALPDAFYRADAKGRRGFAEWGFLSTTSNKAVALTYSYAGEGHAEADAPIPIVIIMDSSAVDRGASIFPFSQYPKVRPPHPSPPLLHLLVLAPRPFGLSACCSCAHMCRRSSSSSLPCATSRWSRSTLR